MCMREGALQVGISNYIQNNPPSAAFIQSLLKYLQCVITQALNLNTLAKNIIWIILWWGQPLETSLVFLLHLKGGISEQHVIAAEFKRAYAIKAELKNLNQKKKCHAAEDTFLYQRLLG